MSAIPILIVGKTVLNEAILIAVDKGLQVIDERLDSYVKAMKRKRGEERNGKTSCYRPREGCSLQ